MRGNWAGRSRTQQHPDYSHVLLVVEDPQSGCQVGGVQQSKPQTGEFMAPLTSVLAQAAIRPNVACEKKVFIIPDQGKASG